MRTYCCNLFPETAPRVCWCACSKNETEAETLRSDSVLPRKGKEIFMGCAGYVSWRVPPERNISRLSRTLGASLEFDSTLIRPQAMPDWPMGRLMFWPGVVCEARTLLKGNRGRTRKLAPQRDRNNPRLAAGIGNWLCHNQALTWFSFLFHTPLTENKNELDSCTPTTCWWVFWRAHSIAIVRSRACPIGCPVGPLSLRYNCQGYLFQ
ncbi:uncharacterized protein EI97DRAFT_473270 [Westerdykella ornata]|uniref:Uncharacterized protein n=1 Tax=Westerdykella ornata TaxID=318751 RepID=A0A6A6JYX9_WESOR|nr:uncharacterized protein EI97DRAFT_473270 [Westerdykella ornata]KAF2281617.1 hypothetical protein EI97DRAFT_473270 [Westerdykella ornata]